MLEKLCSFVIFDYFDNTLFVLVLFIKIERRLTGVKSKRNVITRVRILKAFGFFSSIALKRSYVSYKLELYYYTTMHDILFC